MTLLVLQVQGVDISTATLEALSQLPALTSLAMDGLDGSRGLLMQRLTRLSHLSLSVRYPSFESFRKLANQGACR